MVVAGCSRTNINTEASNKEGQTTEETINETENREDKNRRCRYKENNDIVQIDDTNEDNQAETEEKDMKSKGRKNQIKK